MLARRLLMASGGQGAFAPPPPPAAAAFAVTSAPDGGWTIGSPVAVEHDGVTYIAYLDNSGNIEIRTWSHTGGTSAPVTLHSSLQADTHAAPAVLVRPDGHVVVAYCAHDAGHMYVRISTNPHDISAWSAEQDRTFAGDMTYPVLVQLTDVADDPVYLFFREYTGAHIVAYAKSTDGGATWGSKVRVYTSTSGYWHIGTNGLDRIDLAMTDIAASALGGSGAANQYHAYFEGSDWHQTDGTAIVASPFDHDDATLVMTGASADGGCFPMGVSAMGDPALSVQVILASGTDNAYWDCRWTGAAWVSTLVANAGGVWYSTWAPGCTNDYGDPDVHYGARKVGGAWQMWRYASGDSGATWTGSMVNAPATSVEGVNPQSVWGHGSGLEAVWLTGTYTTDTNWDTGISGYGTG